MNSLPRMFVRVLRSFRKAIIVFLTLATIAQPLAPLAVFAQESATSTQPVASDSQSAALPAASVSGIVAPDTSSTASASAGLPAVADSSLDKTKAAANSSVSSPALAGAQTVSLASSGSAGGTSQSATPSLVKKLPDIDQNTGALKYDFPIVVPPGRNGMQPDLSLSYNSSNEEQNSIFGYGWSINIPYIQLLNKTGFDTMYDSTSPKYFYSSIDGELANISGASYAARREDGDFNKYAFLNNQWVMTGKDGTQYKFGYDTTGRQDDPANSTNIYKWMLQEIRYTNNNYITFSYVKGDGQIYPASIQYTGNGATDGIFRIDFIRTARPDNALASYSAGFSVTSNYYISEIDAEANGNWVTKYVLNYGINPTNTRSLLNSITVSSQAADNTISTLPAQTFTYQNSAPGWTQSGNLPAVSTGFYGTYSGYVTEGYVMIPSDNLQYIDLNGDGLPDYVDYAFSFYYSRHGCPYGCSGTTDACHAFSMGCCDSTGPTELRNSVVGINKGTSWDTSDTAWNLPSSSFFANACVSSYMSIQFADLNGDGLPDLIESYTDTKSSPGHINFASNVYLNTGHGWTQATGWSFPAGAAFPWQVSSVAFADVNGDGLPDLNENLWNNSNGQSLYEWAVFINNGSGWVASPILPQTSSPYSSPFADLSGDGLPEVTSVGGNAIVTQRVESPNKWTTWNAFTNYYPNLQTPGGTPVNSLMALNDWNNDGRLDVLMYNIDTGNASNNSFKIFQNNISGIPANGTYVSLPVTSSGNALQFADFNGDGLHDYAQAAVIANNQGVSYNGTIFSNTGTKQDLLSKITYPQGGNTAVSYKTAAQYPGNKSPYPLFVVSQITNSDGAGSTFGNTYSYSGGTYYYGSALDRQFAGFGQISQTDAAGYATKTYFHTGTGTDSANGEYQDNFYKIGKVYRTENYDNAGNLYRVGINKWDQVSLGAGSNFVKLVRTVGQDFDGLATHRDRAQAFSYDDTTGNLIRKIDYGEVAANTDGSFTDIGSDEYSANYSYAAPVSGSNVTAAVSDVATLDQNSNKVKESRFYYDGLALGSVSLGNQTKQENWVTGSNYAGSQKIYNGYGLVTQSLDPNGNATNFTYDSYNLYPANVTNALNQTVAYIYNYGTGQVSQTTDANNFVFRTTYDGFGRVLQQSQPDLANPASQVPKSSFIYNDSSLNVSVQETDYLDGQTVVTNYSYYDGLGRAIQTKKSARNGNFETKDLIYDTRGNLQKESLPYFASTAAKTSPTSTSQLYTAYVYDALGRKTSSTNTLGTTATSYKNWQTTVTDANSNSKDYFSDAHGNLIKVVEHNGSDAYATAYTYDGQANLLGIIDAAGNVRNFTYDGLGHVLTAQDLHPANAATFGTRSYAYDNAGNLLSLVDSKNQTVNYVYDALNRQKTESAGGVTAKTFTYDNCVDGTGRLCQVVLPDETESFEYNALGGVAKDTKTRDSQAFVTAYAYDRLGNKLSATNPDGSVVKFTYNTAGMAESVSRQESTDPTPLGVIASFDYSPAEQVNAINYASGIATTDTHDASQLYRLTRKLSVAGSANLQDLNYQYDPVGNITQTADNSGTQTRKNAAYGYDKLYRLTSANITNTANSQDYSQAFTYDALGNMLTQKLNDTTLTYSYNGGNNPSGNPDAATSIVTAMPLTAPAIGSFAAAPSVIAAGTPVTLSWTLSGGTPDTLTIDNNIGPVLGTASKTVSPTSTTTYTLTAANAAGTNTATAKVTIVVAPLISTFTASPTPINPGGTSTLAWTLAGGTPDTLTIDNNVGSVTGTSSKSVSPTTSTTYKLTAANVAGSATATVTVNVLAAPIISAFTANPTAIASGQSSTLSWTLGGGATTALSIDNNVGSVMGKTSITVKPTATTTYKLTATNAAGTATAPVTVTIVAKPAINSFNASSTSINQGSSTTLSWTLGGGAVTALSIDNNVGSVLGTTSKSVSPSATTTYKLTATNVAGTVTATVKVTVTVVKPTITVFTASQTTITKGNSTTLSWTLAGSPATALSINQNVGSVLGKTAVSVKPASTTTYTLTATNSAGSATKTVTVTVKMAESTDPFADFASAASKVFCAIADTFSVPVAYAATITITANYQYDANGNLLTDGKTTYTYDYLNRIVTATTGIAANGTVSAYSYDYQGQRDKSLVTVTATDAATGNVTTKSTTTYTPTSNYSTATLVTTVKDKNGNQISTTTAPTEITKHIFANGQMLATVKGTGAAAKVYYDLTDNINGSTVVLDSNNAIVETTDYYPFGAIRFDNQVNYSEKRKYIGQEYDAETTLSYLNARYYNGTIGRFTTEDPVFWGKQNFSDPQSLNTYSYASNKPITLSDPSGLASWSDIQNQLNAISAQVAALTAKVNSFVSAQAKTAVQNISTAAKYASSTINQTAGAAKTQVCNGLTALDKGMTAASNYLNSNSYIGAALFIVGMGEGGNGEFGEIEAESEVAQNAEQGTIQLNGPINNIANRLEHVFERHTSAGAMSIGKSTFNSGEDVVQLIQQGTQQPIVKQISGSNFERIYDLGRNIGVDRATGQQTSIMTVITNKSGNLITAFPGQP